MYLVSKPPDDAALVDRVVEQAALAADPHERDLRSGVVGQAQPHVADRRRVQQLQPQPLPGWTFTSRRRRERSGSRRRARPPADVHPVREHGLALVRPARVGGGLDVGDVTRVERAAASVAVLVDRMRSAGSSG